MEVGKFQLILRKWPSWSLNAQYSSQVAQRRNLSKFLLSRRHPSQPNAHTIDRTEKVSEIQFLLLGVFCRNFLWNMESLIDSLHHHCPLAVISNRDLKRIANWAKEWKVTLNPGKSKGWYYKLCCLSQSTRWLCATKGPPSGGGADYVLFGIVQSFLIFLLFRGTQI